VLEPWLREIFGLKTDGVAGENKIAYWGAVWFVLVSECWWGVNWETVGQIGQEK